MGTVTLLIAFAATGLLALGMPAHARAALAGGPWERMPRAVWKLAGWSFVLGAFAYLVVTSNRAVGPVGWLLALGVAGFLVTLMLTYRPRWLPVAIATTLLGAVTVFGLGG